MYKKDDHRHPLIQLSLHIIFLSRGQDIVKVFAQRATVIDKLQVLISCSSSLSFDKLQFQVLEEFAHLYPLRFNILFQNISNIHKSRANSITIHHVPITQLQQFINHDQLCSLILDTFMSLFIPSLNFEVILDITSSVNISQIFLKDRDPFLHIQ